MKDLLYSCLLSARLPSGSRTLNWHLETIYILLNPPWHWLAPLDVNLFSYYKVYGKVFIVYTYTGSYVKCLRVLPQKYRIMPGLCIWYSSPSLFIDDTMPFMYAQTDPVTMWRWTTVMWEGYEGWGRWGRRIQGTAEFLCRLSLVLLSWMGGTPLFVCSSLCESSNYQL